MGERSGDGGQEFLGAEGFRIGRAVNGHECRPSVQANTEKIIVVVVRQWP